MIFHNEEKPVDENYFTDSSFPVRESSQSRQSQLITAQVQTDPNDRRKILSQNQSDISDNFSVNSESYKPRQWFHTKQELKKNSSYDDSNHSFSSQSSFQKPSSIGSTRKQPLSSEIINSEILQPPKTNSPVHYKFIDETYMYDESDNISANSQSFDFPQVTPKKENNISKIPPKKELPQQPLAERFTKFSHFKI